MLEFFETLSMCLGGFIGSLGLGLCFLSLAACGFAAAFSIACGGLDHLPSKKSSKEADPE